MIQTSTQTPSRSKRQEAVLCALHMVACGMGDFPLDQIARSIGGVSAADALVALQHLERAGVVRFTKWGWRLTRNAYSIKFKLPSHPMRFVFPAVRAFVNAK